jgi:hypothetical protein
MLDDDARQSLIDTFTTARRERELSFSLWGSFATTQIRGVEISAVIERYVERLLARNFPVTIVTSLPTNGPFTLARWRRMVQGLCDGRLSHVIIDDDRLPGGGADSWLGLSWERGVRGRQELGAIDVGASLNGVPPLSLADFVAFCVDLGETSGLTFGALTRDGMGFPQAVNEQAFMRGIPVGPTAYARYVCRPGWGLWLTDGHLAALGGRAAVRDQAPVHRVLERPAGLWLEPTPSPWEVPPEAVARLVAYLAPLTPSLEQIQAADPAPVDAEEEAENDEPLTAADDYRDYAGALPDYERLEAGYEDDPLNVHLGQPPSAEAFAALRRCVDAWDAATRSYSEREGPTVDGLAYRWTGELDWGDTTEEELLRRLAGWSAAWSCPIEVVRLGFEAE